MKTKSYKRCPKKNLIVFLMFVYKYTTTSKLNSQFPRLLDSTTSILPKASILFLPQTQMCIACGKGCGKDHKEDDINCVQWRGGGGQTRAKKHLRDGYYKRRQIQRELTTIRKEIKSIKTTRKKVQLARRRPKRTKDGRNSKKTRDSNRMYMN